VKLAFVISAVARLDLLHQREPEALRGAALDLALDRCGLIALPTSCAVPIQTTRVRPSSTSTSATTRIAHARARRGRGRR
jgi:hypothetical protein